MKNLWMLFFALALAACGQNETGKPVEPQFTAKAPELGKEYVFAIHPLHNPAHPLLDYLNRNIPGTVFKLEASRNYDEFDKRLYARHFDFALPYPCQTLNSLGRGYHVDARMKNSYRFTGVASAKRDSGINKIADLKGKKVLHTDYPDRLLRAASRCSTFKLTVHYIGLRSSLHGSILRKHRHGTT